jgi:hypothetical protein
VKIREERTAGPPIRAMVRRTGPSRISSRVGALSLILAG